MSAVVEKKCCCCFPLRLGGALVGLYNLADWGVKVCTLARVVGSYPHHLSSWQYLWLYLTVLQCGAQLTIGVSVLIATLMEEIRALKLSACSLLVMSFLGLALGTVSSWSNKHPATFLTCLLDFIMLSFCAFVLSALVAAIKESNNTVDREIT